MSRRIELDFHVLRRRVFPNVDNERTAGPNIEWLESQLHAFVAKHSADVLFESLLDASGAWHRPNDVVESVRRLIEGGWIEVTALSLGGGLPLQAPDAEREIIELRELVTLRPADPEPTPEPSDSTPDPTTAAQVAALIAAAEAGHLFCEVCAAGSTKAEEAPRARQPAVDPVAAAQVANLVAAAQSGASFCEICA